MQHHGISKAYNDVVFYEIYGVEGTRKNINVGTGLKLTNPRFVKSLEHRFALINVDNTNIYVGDYLVYDDDLNTLIQKAKAVGKTEGCYVSNIVTSRSFHNPSSDWGYELARTAKEFFEQYEKEKWSFWSKHTIGIEPSDEKAMGAVSNLYDNQLIFPQMSKRTVLVRHINVGTNQTISTEIIDAAQPIKSNNLTIKADTSTINGAASSSNYSGYQEYYESLVAMDQTVTKEALADTNNYKYLGHNIAVSTSLDLAKQSIKTRIGNGKYNTDRTVTAAAKDVQSESDYIVIDFYYTEYEKEVEVNHLYVDSKGSVIKAERQTITPNTTAIMDGKNVNRINKDTYVKETYVKRMGKDITTRVADSLLDKINSKEIEYKGYEVLNSKKNISNLVGKKVGSLNKGKTATITGRVTQVNFYYYVENVIEEKEPEKDIEGKVFVNPDKSKDTISTSCNDTTDNISIVSIPSGSYATVGITGLPRYMVGAITAQYVNPNEVENEMNITLKFTMAGQEKKISLNDIKYRVGYYKITDMAVYKLTQTTIYDAKNGTNGTLGDSLFTWKNDQLKTNPKSMDLAISLTGINGRTISNTSSSINNIDNYVAVSIEDKNGKKTNLGTTNSVLKRVYLTKQQFEEVDSNGDNVINGVDKTFADSELARYNTILKNAQAIQSQKQTIYDNALSLKSEKETNLENAEKELEERLEAYNNAEEEKSNKASELSTANGDLTSLQQQMQLKEEELEALTIDEEAKFAEKQTAIQNSEAADKMKEKLNKEYLNSIDERNMLAKKADCNDSVSEEVEIYLEQHEKDALEQCRRDKQAYAKNLEDKVVEKAQKRYENYSEIDWPQAKQDEENAIAAYNIVVYNKNEKQKEISTTNIQITSLQSVIEILDREYKQFVRETYTPAKNAYEGYEENEYTNAKNDYDNYISGKYVENALAELNVAKQETKEAQENYDKYKKYRDNLYLKYDEYKAAYDEFMKITESNAASMLGLKLNMFVQNMIVTVNGTELTTAKSNTASKTYDVQTLLNNKDIVAQVTTERPVISKDVYSNIDTTYTKEEDYTNSSYIAKEVLNGVRVLAGKAEYEAEVVIGDKSVNEISDTIYYSDQKTDASTVVFKLKTNKLSKTYKLNTSASVASEKYKETTPVNIYTPITVSAKLESDTNQIIDQTSDDSLNASMIQLNTPFTINLSNDVRSAEYNINNTKKYSGGYYVKFAFDVQNVSINGKTYKNGNVIPAGTWIGIITKKNNKAYITAQANGNLGTASSNMVSEENSYYTVRGVAYNASDIMKNRSTSFETIQNMTEDTSELKDMVYNICKNPSYFAEETYNVIIANRAYEFRVTDIKDLNWKSVFRTVFGSNTNQHKGVLYYSGSTKWNIKTDKSNDIIPRTSAEIGRNPLRILPIGPYKNTDLTYVKAPKLGYRFSFDMKVTGSYYDSTGNPRTDKKVAIATKFYYISKDGKTYLKEYDGTGEGIYLFYKTNEGKYVRIDNNGGRYNLTFVPNDGYRYIEDNEINTLSTKTVSLGNLRNLTLEHNMATVSPNGAVITYYGEYKLPNSTIVVKVKEDGSYNINDQLKNGYIGVVFDIVAYAGKVKVDNELIDVGLSYSKNTKKNQPNTSQWDYEGFLGYTSSGEAVSEPINLRLENGIWKITNKIYNEIKGSVILYDLDERAATDYE